MAWAPGGAPGSIVAAVDEDPGEPRGRGLPVLELVEALERPQRAVGHFFDLADLGLGGAVIDLGSGSGLDVLFAADQVGAGGHVVGIDFTVEQLENARSLASAGGYPQVELREGRIEGLPADDGAFDCVISNGVINLSPDKEGVFAEAARALRPGAAGDRRHRQRAAAEGVDRPRRGPVGLLHRAAAQQDAYREAIESAGLRVEEVRENPYRFISERAVNASEKYGVKSVSLLARKE